MKPKPLPKKNSNNVEEIVIPQKKKTQNTEWIKAGIISVMT